MREIKFDKYSILCYDVDGRIYYERNKMYTMWGRVN